MKVSRLAAIAALLALAACEAPAPDVDPHNPVVDGKHMTQAEYLNRYCNSRPADQNCIAVSKAMRADATKPNQPKGW